MPRRKAPPPPPPPTADGNATRRALRESAAQAEALHRAWAGQTFEFLRQIPIVGDSAAAFRQSHDALTSGLYTALRQGGDSLLDLAGGEGPPDGPRPLAESIHQALDAAFGDHPAAPRQFLAMGLRIGGRSVPLERHALAAAYPEAGDRLAVFLHGLGCDEYCWEAGVGEIDMPRQLAADTGFTALTPRYHTGLPIVENGAQLAVLLEALLGAWPRPVRELVIIGHSMGGLVARSACTQGEAAGHAWLERTRLVVCLGSPDFGAPLDAWGEWAATALRLAAITPSPAPVRRQAGAPTASAGHIAWRFVGGSLAEDPDDPLGEIVGDGLVTLASATTHPLTGDVDSVRLGGVGHMDLIKSARAYARLVEWVGKPD